MKTSPTVADVFRAFGPAYRQAHPHLPFDSLQVMRAIETCRTPQRGAHVYTCDHCGKHSFSYFSCRNRHCPTCQFLLDAPGAFGKLLSQLYHTPWNVDCKPPFGGPQHVLKYLSAYTHRIAISNHRILALHQQNVTFRYRDSADGNKTQTMTLHGFEFLRRFLLHVLPKGFVRIRHYGLLSNRNRKTQGTTLSTRCAFDASRPSIPARSAF